MQYYYNRHIMSSDVISSIVPNTMVGREAICVFDRSQKIQPVEGAQTIAPMPTATTDEEFGNICAQRIDQIKSIAKKRPLFYIFGRPGIDNAVVLYALQNANANVSVLVDDRHIDTEDQWFVENILSKHNVVPLASANNSSRNDQLSKIISTGVLITPALGSMILGPSISEYEAAGISSNGIQPNDIYEELLAEKSDVQRNVAMRTAEMCPFKINTAKEFVWWFSFVFRYQIEQLKDCLRIPGSIIEQNIFAFFDSTAFNEYAISIPFDQRLPGNDLTNNKKFAVDYMSRFCDITDFNTYKNKKMHVPLATTPGNDVGFFRWIDTDWNRGY